jgi:hypothetical protein
MYYQLLDTGFQIKIKRVCTYLCRVFIHTYIHICMHICMYKHTHTHTHTHIYIYIYISCSLPSPTERQNKSYFTNRYPQVTKVIIIRVIWHVTMCFRLSGYRRFERSQCLYSPKRMDVFKWNYHPLFHSLQFWKFIQEFAVVMRQHFSAKAKIVFDVKTISAQKSACVFT